MLHAPWHEHSAEGEESDGSCCYCALKSLFDEFACSEADTIPPDSLRQALSSVYDAKGRFKTGDMEDATETIEAILGILHACNVQPVGLCQSPCDQHPSAEFVEEASDSLVLLHHHFRQVTSGISLHLPILPLDLAGESVAPSE